MIQLSRWKVILVVVAAVWGLLFTLPNFLPADMRAKMPGWLPGKTLNLGLDLQGGSHLLMSVDTAALHKQKLTDLVEDVRTVLANEKVATSSLGQVGDGVSVTIVDPSQLETAYKAISRLATPTQGGGRELDITRGPNNTIRAVFSAEAIRTEGARAVDKSIEIVRRRVDALGTKEPSISRQGTDRIVVDVPGESDPEQLKRVIGQTAKLTFQMLDESVPVAEAMAGHVPPGSEVLKSDNPNEPYVLVKKRVLVSGDSLTSAKLDFDPQNGQPVIAFRFNSLGAKKFGEATTRNVGKRFAIVLDNRVLSAPVIQTPITGGSGQISGNFTQESAKELADLLEGGALPAPLRFEEQSKVGAELGADAVKAGAISLAIGAAAIFAFIILSYGLFGVFAAIALVVNVLMILGLMSMTQATLTLPGVAGLILTLAVAVDANVLVYERMRDEARTGHAPRMAADVGFRRAMVSIFDANVTTLIAAAIMFQFGSGPVKGFAWTLSVGVITSVFTALLITQVLIGWWFRVAKPKQLPI